MSRYSMLDFPLYINSTALPFPSKWSEKSNVVETVNKTEAGTDQVEVVRYDKLTISCEFGCTNTLAATLKGFSKLSSVTVKYYDTETDAYKERTMRMRKYSQTLASGSHTLSEVRGVWSVLFDLEEF